MKLPRLVTTIAIIIVLAWIISQLFRLAAWLLNGLVGAAAVVIIIALIYRWLNGSGSTTTHRSRPIRKDPLKIEREPSKEK